MARITSKELVLRTLEFRNTDGRVPRQLWTLPWAGMHYPNELKAIVDAFEWDIDGPDTTYETLSPVARGRFEDPGEAVDHWGCVFTCIQRGIMGEVKQPIIDPEDEDWQDLSRVHIPEELLSFDVDGVNRSCAQKKDKFLMGNCCPRPFERLQFLRSSQNLYCDLALRPKGMLDFMARMHDYYCRLLEKWASTDVDALNFMDDWGSQRGLLIHPDMWRALFKPMYKDYIDIAHRNGKKIFMHSDGYTLDIIPDLIELGLDAFNTQIFCMSPELLRPFRGKITFWGEICRQHIIPHGTKEEVQSAVRRVYENLWQDGGCIAQCEFGPGGNPENVMTIYETWRDLRK